MRSGSGGGETSELTLSRCQTHVPMRAVVAWRDRDWARFDDDEWAALTTAAVAAPRRRTARTAGRVVLAAGISLAATLFLHSAHAPDVRIPAAPPANAMSIRWRTSDLVPAATAGRICVTNNRRGRLCASYAPGEKPADALTRQLAS